MACAVAWRCAVRLMLENELASELSTKLANKLANKLLTKHPNKSPDNQARKLENKLPALYTFRRCPYAIRARLAIKVSGIRVEEIEVKLSDKPAALIAISPKATVPVLHFADGTVIEESLDIMRWALALHDPDSWLAGRAKDNEDTDTLINTNDTNFKQALDCYKYPDRFPEHTQQHYRDVDAAVFLGALETRLSETRFLFGNNITLADAAIFPFVRQYAAVDIDWFNASAYVALRGWHDAWQASALFQSVMRK